MDKNVLMRTLDRAARKVPQPPQSAGPTVGAVSTPTVLQSLNFKILIAFLFIIFSRILDVWLSGLHIPGITYRILALFLVLTGAFVTAFRDSIGKCVLGFTAFFLLAIPFSVWRSGSLQVLTEQWLTALVVFVATAALVLDFQQYRRTANAIAIAIVVLTVICKTRGIVDNGRLFLDSGRFSNPNEMAQALLLGMPFVWAIYSTTRSPFAKIFSTASLLLMIYVISKTGSRGAMISIGVIVAWMFLRTTPLGKVKVVVTMVLLFGVAVLTLPGDLKARYQTFFTADDDEDVDQPVDQTMLKSAVASADSRKEMLKRSLVLTAKHPFLGVGPGNFAVAENDLARTEGKRRGAWLGTHNSFTEVSSECGIPAFLFYAGILVLSFKKSYALYRRTRNAPQWKDISTHALALNYSLIAFTVTGVFIHAAYTALLPVLAGLTVSLVRTAQPLLAQAAPTVVPAAATAAAGRPRPRRRFGLAYPLPHGRGSAPANAAPATARMQKRQPSIGFDYERA